jgi:hypothetical protein
LNNLELGTLSKKFQENYIFFSLIAAKILIAGSSLRGYNRNDAGADLLAADVTQVFDLTDTIKVFTICF